MVKKEPPFAKNVIWFHLYEDQYGDFSKLVEMELPFNPVTLHLEPNTQTQNYLKRYIHT